MATLELTDDVEERILAKTARHGDCLIWKGATSGSSGPKCRVGGAVCSVARVMWELSRHKEPPQDKIVIKTCGDWRCVEPDHLTLGDRADLGLVQASTGHTARPRSLTDEQVKEIRESNESQAELGRRFGVSWDTIYSIRRGDFYKVEAQHE